MQISENSKQIRPPNCVGDHNCINLELDDGAMPGQEDDKLCKPC